MSSTSSIMKMAAVTQNSILQQYPPTKVTQFHPSEPHIWALINNYFPQATTDRQFWWRTTGIPLAILLWKAGYSIDAQCQNLLFYYCCIVPELEPVLMRKVYLDTGKAS